MRKGFTIVELLIVVVVIAILATITVVAYRGIQQRTNNAAVVDAASKVQRLVQAYMSSNHAYPYTLNADYICVTTTTTCMRNSPSIPGSATFDTNISTIGSPPRSAPVVSAVRGGVVYSYNSTRTVDGRPAPAAINYYLFGVNTDCVLRPLLANDNTVTTTVSTVYSDGNVGGSGATHCIVSLPHL